MNKFSEKYFDILQTKFYGLNLTSFKNVQDIDAYLYRDSILPLKHSASFKKSLEETEYIIDIGFGGGFPILPLAQEFTIKNLIGIEARNKKADAVRIIAKEMLIDNVKLIHQRFENIIFDIESVITFKAVGEIPKILKKLKVSKKSYVYFYKGPKEKDFCDPEVKNWKLVEKVIYNDDKLGERVLIGFENINVPHGTGNKNLVNLTSII